tara:strand:- start:4548 stop:4862 length:315 start_codon:yes stop_codon:yes gene_type:complete
MQKFLGDLVDQVTFVNYLPWENVYESNKSEIKTPCFDLWRRMIVWWDDIKNPCDIDYKSTFNNGNINNSAISELWRGQSYENLRNAHIKKLRYSVSPCNKCTLI